MEDFDRVLSAEEEIVPSSGFTRAVMGAVLHEASRPMPIAFPWKRAVPGLVLIALVITTLVFMPAAVDRTGGNALATMKLAAMLMSVFKMMERFYVNWLLGSLLLAWACVNLSMLFASLRS